MPPTDRSHSCQPVRLLPFAFCIHRSIAAEPPRLFASISGVPVLVLHRLWSIPASARRECRRSWCEVLGLSGMWAGVLRGGTGGAQRETARSRERSEGGRAVSRG